jgi:hypothetical protein
VALREFKTNEKQANNSIFRTIMAPLPEPATAALLLAGTTLLILRRKPRTR